MFDVQVAIDSALEGKSEKEVRRWERFQAEQRAKLEIGDPNTIYGKRAIEIALAEIGVNGETPEELERLAEGYFLLGEFERALETPNEQKKEEYRKYLDGLTNAPCDCAKKHLGHSTRFLKDKITRRGQLLNFYSCSLCRCLSL